MDISIHQLLVIWVVSIRGLLWVMLLWTFLCKVLFEHMFSILLSIYTGLELLGHMVILCLTFRGTTKLFSTVTITVYIPTSNVWWTLIFIQGWKIPNSSGWIMIGKSQLMDIIFSKNGHSNIFSLSCFSWNFLLHQQMESVSFPQETGQAPVGFWTGKASLGCSAGSPWLGSQYLSDSVKSEISVVRRFKCRVYKIQWENHYAVFWAFNTAPCDLH